MTVQPAEIIYTNSKRVACDGGGGALGHPRVWLEMGVKRQVECPYCDRLYVLSSPSGSHGTSGGDRSESALGSPG